MTPVEIELEGMRRYLKRNQDLKPVTFIVGKYAADLMTYRAMPQSREVEMAINRLEYFIRRRPGSVSFEVRQ